MVGNSVDAFRQGWFRRPRALPQALPAGERIVTIYAWNEWSEGGYLEPEASSGMKYLKPSARLLANSRRGIRAWMYPWSACKPAHHTGPENALWWAGL